MKRQVMKRAWEIARQGVAQFGGKVREYIAESLRMAWAEAKEESSVAEKIEKIIDRYNLRVFGENIGADKSIQDHPEDVEFLKSHKAEIISFIKRAEEEKKRAYEDYCKKVREIEGLEEIRAAKSSMASWMRRFERTFEGEYAVGGYGMNTPKYDKNAIDALCAKYPRAAAYLTAESFCNASHWFKSSVGRTAMEKIANGENYTAVIAEMESEWHKYCEENIG